MGRPAGSRNPDFEVQRQRLLRAALVRLGEPDGARASFRELAAATGVSVATLRHYFESREQLIEEALALTNVDGQRYLLEVATGPLPPVRASLGGLLAYLGIGFRNGLERIHALGIAAGMQQERLGPAYLRQVFDPTLESIEARLARHVARGELLAGDVRHMALALVGPPLLALLHQGVLGGVHTRPLSYEALCADHLSAFLRAFGTGHEAPAEPGAMQGPPGTTESLGPDLRRTTAEAHERHKAPKPRH
ncbi:MAG: TetR/AcrR family transcriptional regulator [Polyangiaceae bacterium]